MPRLFVCFFSCSVFFSARLLRQCCCAVVAVFIGMDTACAQIFGINVLDSSAQRELSKWIRASGSASIFSEAYLTGNIANARRPLATIRANIQTTFTLFDQISVPFELMLSTENVSFRQPFNQFGIAPRFGENVQLYGGYHTISLSPLSAGDVRILGGGADVRLGNFRAVASVGESQRAAMPDSAGRFPGSLARLLMAGRLEYRSDSGAVVGLNAVRGRDDASSLPATEAHGSSMFHRLEALDNFVLSIDTKLPLLANTLTLEAEFATSRNGALWAELATLECGFGENLPIVSADKLRMDYAARLLVNYASPDAFPLSVRLRAEYFGPGFTTLGFPQLPNDRLEADIAPQLRLLDGKLIVGASLGYLVNNLLGDRITTAERLIGAANITAQITDFFGIDAQYQNYGIRVAPPPNYSIIQPTMPIEQLQTQQVFGMFSLMPRAFFTIGSYQQNLSLSISVQQFADANEQTQRFTENSSQMMRFLWVSQIEKLALTLNIGQTMNQSAFAQFAATEVSLAASHPFLEQKLLPTLTIAWTKTTETSGLESRLSSTLRANYRLSKTTDAVVVLQGNYYTYKPGSRSPSYGEAQMSLEIRQRL